jgi:hypothetical protein
VALLLVTSVDERIDQEQPAIGGAQLVVSERVEHRDERRVGADRDATLHFV